MSPGLSFSLHAWRGIGRDAEPDLFLIRLRLGFATASIDKVSILESYRKLRATMLERVRIDQEKIDKS